jgi:four helix bundle protein
MFDFEKLEVYTKSRRFNSVVRDYLKNNAIDKVSSDQLRRAALSIMLNIAEGAGRYSRLDKRRFYIFARGSVFECVAIFDYLRDGNCIDTDSQQELYSSLEEISRILFALIKGLEK